MRNVEPGFEYRSENTGKVLLRHGVTLNSHQATSPFVMLVEREERWVGPDPAGCSPSKLRWNGAISHCHLYGAHSSPYLRHWVDHNSLKKLEVDRTM
ncbi:hypothetical protein TNCV_4002011 [Trichonephila clavipes]|uniref:Uncharacterized protein n=1 Tax=Trichonephila clavipes TaxID=2585209 RepID=A0A8X6V852_TRICX|nr:hypothetical protein TNCV_4002011 [Trichonephila clavipes]